MLFSVVIPVYNSSLTLTECVKSVLGQTVSDWEVLIVDDGSLDGTAALIGSHEVFRDDRIHYIWQNHRGVSQARNRGIIEARGEYIAFLDGDDHWIPDKLKSALMHIRAGADFIYSDARVERENGQTWLYSEHAQPYEGWVLPRLFRANFICTSTVVVRRLFLLRSGLFDCLFRSCEDYLMWLKMARYARFVYVPVPLTVHNLHDYGISGQRRVSNYVRLVVVKASLLDSYNKGLWLLLGQIVTRSPRLAAVILRSIWTRMWGNHSNCERPAGALRTESAEGRPLE